MISAMELLAAMGCWRAVRDALARWDELSRTYVWHHENFDAPINDLRNRLREAEIIEARWGAGSLLNLDHADVRQWLDCGLPPRNMAVTAVNYRSAAQQEASTG
jgi:hypothetical protein